jgi:transposase
MLTTDLSLPDNVKELQILVVEMHKKMDDLKRNYEVETQLLRERVNQLIQEIYGRKSEKFSSLLSEYDGFAQSLLFEEPREGNLRESKNENSGDEEIIVAEHKRKKRGRKPLPPEFERIEIVHDLSEEEKQCGCDIEMEQIGEEISEELEMTPARFWVIRHIRLKYACKNKNCEGVERAEGEKAVKIAPVPLQLVPKSIATPSLLSHIFVSKFCDSLPFYRQEQQFRRLGLELSRGTMCIWTVKVAEKCKRLVELLRQVILSGPLINIDETTFQVLCEPDRRVDSKSYMWVFRGGPPGSVAVVYIYDESRSGSVASEFLGDFQGYVQTDGFSGYDFLDIREGIIHAGCWAHARRKFFTVVKVLGGKGKVENLEGFGKAGEAVQTIRDLYAIEKKARDMDLPDQRQLIFPLDDN